MEHSHSWSNDSGEMCAGIRRHRWHSPRPHCTHSSVGISFDRPTSPPSKSSGRTDTPRLLRISEAAACPVSSAPWTHCAPSMLHASPAKCTRPPCSGAASAATSSRSDPTRMKLYAPQLKGSSPQRVTKESNSSGRSAAGAILNIRRNTPHTSATTSASVHPEKPSPNGGATCATMVLGLPYGCRFRNRKRWSVHCRKRVFSGQKHRWKRMITLFSVPMPMAAMARRLGSDNAGLNVTDDFSDRDCRTPRGSATTTKLLWMVSPDCVVTRQRGAAAPAPGAPAPAAAASVTPLPQVSLACIEEDTGAAPAAAARAVEGGGGNRLSDGDGSLSWTETEIDTTRSPVRTGRPSAARAMTRL
mmetsp:Transcript_4152/g.10127  ORF Transcript_4152/g.10127 Transcript_4152/m.10127 type:complete len:359 (-) Transcript_4152:2924-4000(-)